MWETSFGKTLYFLLLQEIKYLRINTPSQRLFLYLSARLDPWQLSWQSTWNFRWLHLVQKGLKMNNMYKPQSTRDLGGLPSAKVPYLEFSTLLSGSLGQCASPIINDNCNLSVDAFQVEYMDTTCTHTIFYPLHPLPHQTLDTPPAPYLFTPCHSEW